MTRYERIVFLDDDESFDEWYAEFELNGQLGALEYLQQWDYGDSGDVHDTPSNGSRDTVFEHNGYRMSYNFGLHYAGLERIIRD